MLLMSTIVVYAVPSKNTYAIEVKADYESRENNLETLTIKTSKIQKGGATPLGFILVYGFDVDVQLMQLPPGEDYLDIEVLNKPFYIWENEMQTMNPGTFIRLYSARGLFSHRLSFCFGTCEDWAIIG